MAPTAQENDRAFHGFGNNLVRRLIKLLYGFEFKDVMTGYRAFNAVFAKTMPVLSPGFEIETELSIHAVDKRWRIAEVPIDYRDRPEGSVSKLSTFSDGTKVLLTILSLFKDYRPLALFSWLALAFCVLGLRAISEWWWSSRPRGWWPKLPSALLAVALVFVGVLCFASGLILDTVVKGTRKEYELEVTRAYERYCAARGKALFARGKAESDKGPEWAVALPASVRLARRLYCNSRKIRISVVICLHSAGK